MYSNSLFIIQRIDRYWVVPLWNELDFSKFVIYTFQAMISRTLTYLEDIK